MKKFALGFVAMLAAYGIGALAFLMLGFAEVRADVNEPAPIRAWMGMTVRASVRRHAPSAIPSPATDSDVFAGGRHYFDGCAGCHGTPGKPRHPREEFLSPPYLPTLRSQYSEPEIYWIIKHGIRHTGMSAYGPFFKENQIWQTAAFVKRMPDIPQAIIDSLQRPK